MTSSMPNSNNVGVLGVGRFGSALVNGLRAIGVVVQPRERQAHQPLHTWVALCDVICLCVRDDQLEHVVAELSRCDLNSKTVLMHAGTIALETMEPLASAGAVVGKFHPLMSFSEKNERGIPAGTPFAYEGDILPVISPWVDQWQAQHHHVVGEQWQVYHLAAVLSANFLPLFIRFGGNLLTELTGGDLHKALAWLAPLVQASVAKGLDGAITHPFSGPAVRGDGKVLARQAAALEKSDTDWRELYRLASKLIQKQTTLSDSSKKT